MDWFRVGFRYGAEKFPELAWGDTSYNLPAILQSRYQWQSADTVLRFPQFLTRVFPNVLTVAGLLELVYLAALIACSFAIAQLQARRDPRWFIAVTTPWLLFFALMPHLHERYLLWAAAVGSIVIGANIGMTMLVILLTVLSWMMQMKNLFESWGVNNLGSSIAPGFGDSLKRFLAGTYPDLGWVVLLCSAIFLYESLRPGKAKALDSTDSEQASP
jgi:hypothetical protein